MKAQSLSWNIKKQLESLDSSNLAQEVLKVRGYKESEIKSFLSPRYQDELDDPFKLSDMKKATDRIIKAVKNKENIVIYGDYDIDGITASALLHDFFSSIGARVSCYIPDRFEEGYGLNSNALTDIKKAGADLVISVDCGVTAVEQADHAKDIGLDLIITDHHEPARQLPNSAVAVINPKLKKSHYKNRELAGVGVAFSIVRALQKAQPNILLEGREKWLLDLVALGTICDVVPLTGENRILAYYGLRVMRQTRRVGLKALAEISSTKIEEIDESDLGFRFGPRLNAAGRLKHAKAALNLLITQDSNKAIKISQTLDELNRERQIQTHDIFVSADKQAKKQKQNLILVLHDTSWSSGIIGIVASRIAEKWHKPCIMLSVEADIAKGSARSYSKFSIIEAIASCSDLLEKFGGHTFAAGLTIKKENIDLFAYNINQYALNKTDITTLLPSIDIDVSLKDFKPTVEVVDSLVELKPYGNDNQQPLFASQFWLEEFRYVGQNSTHIKFRFRNSNNDYIDGISFSSSHKWPFLKNGNEYRVAYFLQKNVWQSVVKIQLEVIDIKEQMNTKIVQ